MTGHTGSRPNRKPLDPFARIAKWVADGRIIERDGCWVWVGATTHTGYGQVGMSAKTLGLPTGKTVHHVVHRWVYELHVGPIPEGLDLDHLCRVRACCNPDHLEPVTRSENLRRAVGIGNQWSSRSACSNEHPYTEENTARDKSGARVCRQCTRDRARRYYAERKGAA